MMRESAVSVRRVYGTLVVFGLNNVDGGEVCCCNLLWCLLERNGNEADSSSSYSSTPPSCRPIVVIDSICMCSPAK